MNTWIADRSSGELFDLHWRDVRDAPNRLPLGTSLTMILLKAFGFHWNGAACYKEWHHYTSAVSDTGHVAREETAQSVHDSGGNHESSP